MGDFSKNRSNQVQLSRYLREENIVLRGVSALKYMGLYVEDHFTFDVATEKIMAYSQAESDLKNVIIVQVDDFSDIDYDITWGVACATLHQVVHDMLQDPELMDESALVEALANHYENEGHFNEISITDTCEKEWERLKNKALKFYG